MKVGIIGSDTIHRAFIIAASPCGEARWMHGDMHGGVIADLHRRVAVGLHGIKAKVDAMIFILAPEIDLVVLLVERQHPSVIALDRGAAIDAVLRSERGRNRCNRDGRKKQAA